LRQLAQNRHSTHLASPLRIVSDLARQPLDRYPYFGFLTIAPFFVTKLTLRSASMLSRGLSGMAMMSASNPLAMAQRSRREVRAEEGVT
jgi:hypothetical protein